MRYTADWYECEEALTGAADVVSVWRHVIKTTKRGAASKASAATKGKKEVGFVPPPPPPPPQ